MQGRLERVQGTKQGDSRDVSSVNIGQGLRDIRAPIQGCCSGGIRGGSRGGPIEGTRARFRRGSRGGSKGGFRRGPRGRSRGGWRGSRVSPGVGSEWVLGWVQAGLQGAGPGMSPQLSGPGVGPGWVQWETHERSVGCFQCESRLTSGSRGQNKRTPHRVQGWIRWLSRGRIQSYRSGAEGLRLFSWRAHSLIKGADAREHRYLDFITGSDDMGTD